ncbi:MAG TPA: helix-turn-helix domain-containing protein [Candidatus Thermoplasmatota archaeon]
MFASVAAGAGLLGWLAWWSGILQRWLVPVGLFFVRVEPEQAANHLTRAQLLDELGKQRVTSTGELRDRLAINHGTMLWHLRMLERLDVVRSRRAGRIRVWYRRDQKSPTREEILVGNTPDRKTLLDMISKEPGISLSMLARATGLAKSSVHRHIAALANAGLVELRREPLRTCLYPVPT